MERNRPLGITLISLFLIIIGITAFLAAAGMAFLATISSEQFLEMIEGEPSDWFLENYSLVFGAIAMAFLLQGAIALLLAYGFWKAKPWAWWVGMVLALISIIIAFIQPWAIGFNDPAWVSQLIWSLFWPWVIIIYLTRPRIKRYFGRPTE
jgi:lysylphosphatidylglycerol synthetase-like protein (DUF2156 family)